MVSQSKEQSRGPVFANVARGQVSPRVATAEGGPIQRIAVNAATKLNQLQSGGQFSAMIRLARPHQWIKNALVLAALVFGQRLFVFHDVVLAAVAFVAFCALSSAGYVLNDIADRDADRLNPEKCDRPLARGDLTVAAATREALALAAIAGVLSVILGPEFLGIAVLYAALQFVYSLWAKHQVIVDVIAVAIGFVLRAFAGGVAIHVEVSPWLVFITFVLALFLVLAQTPRTDCAGRRRHRASQRTLAVQRPPGRSDDLNRRRRGSRQLHDLHCLD